MASSSDQIDAPISLRSLFQDDSEVSYEETINDKESFTFDQCFETQSLELCGQSFFVRQYSFHSHNGKFKKKITDQSMIY